MVRFVLGFRGWFGKGSHWFEELLKTNIHFLQRSISLDHYADNKVYRDFGKNNFGILWWKFYKMSVQYVQCKNVQTGGKHIFYTNYMIILILHIWTCSNPIYCSQYFGCYGNNLRSDPLSNRQTSDILTKLSIIKLFNIKFWAIL